MFIKIFPRRTTDWLCVWCCVHLQSVLDNLDYESDNFKNMLIALGQITKLHPEVFAVKQKQVIRDFIMKKLMVVDRVRLTFPLFIILALGDYFPPF